MFPPKQKNRKSRTVEVHGRDLGKVRVGQVDVEALALVDEGAALGRHVDQRLLTDLPVALVQLLELRRYLKVLHRASVGHQFVFNVLFIFSVFYPNFG